MGVASGAEQLALGDRKLVGSTVFSTCFHEYERAIVGDKVLLEELVGRSKPIAEQAPEPFARDFAARAIQALDRPLGMFVFRSANFAVDAEIGRASCRERV